MTSPAGPLAGLRVVEFASIGPGPYSAMLLSDLGADVVRIDRPGGNGWPNPIIDRGRAVITLDIRTPGGRDRALELLDRADVLIEGFRPGVMERLGLGPEVVAARNPGLVYGRMTGWGQHGPMARAAGHDINYVALTGALAAMGESGRPATPPLNLVGDFGGGSMFLVFGIMAALWERERSGQGQVVDAAIVDGVTSMMTMFAGLIPSGMLTVDRSRNVLAGASPFYRSYICADGAEVSIGPLEPRFYDLFLDLIEAPEELSTLEKEDEANWPVLKVAFTRLFASKPSAHWRDLLEGTDACFAPVLELHQVPEHPHMKARDAYVMHDGLLQAAPAPRLSRTPGKPQSARDLDTILAAWGVAPA